jgi:hypothetical protein
MEWLGYYECEVCRVTFTNNIEEAKGIMAGGFF